MPFQRRIDRRIPGRASRTLLECLSKHPARAARHHSIDFFDVGPQKSRFLNLYFLVLSILSTTIRPLMTYLPNLLSSTNSRNGSWIIQRCRPVLYSPITRPKKTSCSTFYPLALKSDHPRPEARRDPSRQNAALCNAVIHWTEDGRCAAV